MGGRNDIVKKITNINIKCFFKEISESYLWKNFFKSLLEPIIFCKKHKKLPYIFLIIQLLQKTVCFCLIIPIYEFDFPILETSIYFTYISKINLTKNNFLVEYAKSNIHTKILCIFLRHYYIFFLDLINHLIPILHIKLINIYPLFRKIIQTILIFCIITCDINLHNKLYKIIYTSIKLLGVNFVFIMKSFSKQLI